MEWCCLGYVSKGMKHLIVRSELPVVTDLGMVGEAAQLVVLVSQGW